MSDPQASPPALDEVDRSTSMYLSIDNGAPSIVSRVRVAPRALAGSLRVPGDKSLSHRALLLGALAGGPVELRGLAPSGDVASTAAALVRLGADLRLRVAADGQLAGTVDGPLREADDVLDCGNSGTSLRLLAGIVAAIPGLAVLTGDASLRRRPVARVVAPLRAMGADVRARDAGRVPPLVIAGRELRGVHHDSDVASAQVKSCVLLAGLRADGATTVRSPRASRDHTERMLAHLGHPVTTAPAGPDGPEVVTITGGELRPVPIEVGGDPSSAAFWLVAGAIAGTAVEVQGVNVNPRRTGVLEALAGLGARIQRRDERLQAGEPTATVGLEAGGFTGPAGAPVELAGTRTVDALDELLVLALAAACSPRGVRVRDAGELRVKESDRIAGLERLFQALGLRLRTTADGFDVPGGQRPGGGTVDAGGDHRIAMTACIAGTVASAPVEVTGFEAVTTSYPTFLDDLRRLGGELEVLGSPDD